MPRKSPVRHHVKDHNRKNASVKDHNRGRGQLSVTEIKAKEGTIDLHKRKLKNIGESITYLDNGRRVTGTVRGIRQEYYLVERNDKIYKVDRRSVFTRIGGALKGAGAGLLAKGKEGISRKLAERAQHKAWKKEMEREEKLIFERQKEKDRNAEKRKKFREKIRKGPLWKRALKTTGSLIAKEAQGQLFTKPKKKKSNKTQKKKKAKEIVIRVKT